MDHGVPQNYVEAHKWYNLAASRYPASAAENRGKAVGNRNRVAGKMTVSSKHVAQR